eukprot:6174029-Pleurochrysis_carterae.AAC.1
MIPKESDRGSRIRAHGRAKCLIVINHCTCAHPRTVDDAPFAVGFVIRNLGALHRPPASRSSLSASYRVLGLDNGATMNAQ